MGKVSRVPLNLLVSREGRRALAERAKGETEGNVSELARRMLKYASVNMPKGYR